MSNTTYGHAHASRSTYWLIALVLGIITLLEVAVFYVPVLGSMIAPILLVLSTVKFTLVAMFFMHLRYDHKVLTSVFVIGIGVAGAIIIILMLLFHAFGSGGGS